MNTMKNFAIACILLISSVTCEQKGSADFKMNIVLKQEVNVGFEIKDAGDCSTGTADVSCPTVDGNKLTLKDSYPETEKTITYTGPEEETYVLKLVKKTSEPSSVIFECKEGDTVEQKIDLGVNFDASETQCAESAKSSGITCKTPSTANPPTTVFSFEGTCTADNDFTLVSEDKLRKITVEFKMTSFSLTSKFSASLLVVCLLFGVGY